MRHFINESATLPRVNLRRLRLLRFGMVILWSLAACGGRNVQHKKPKKVTDAGATLSTAPDNSSRLGLVNGLFFGLPENKQRDSLAASEIRDVKLGSGGRSIGFKITLTDGTVGYFKPEQTFSGAHYYSELASYYLDRELGIGRVPPTVGRRVDWKLLVKPLGYDVRREELIVPKDEQLRGAFIWWVPEKLIPIRPGKNWERWIRIRGWPSSAVTPFQRPRVYLQKLGIVPTGDEAAALPNSETPAPAGAQDVQDAQRAETAGLGEVSRQSAPATKEPEAVKEPDTPERAAELSDMIVFDYLIINLDRWGGEYTNVRTRGEHGPLIYLDNGAGFIAQASNGLMRARLHAVEKFRKATIDAIRALDIDKLEKRMQTDPLWPFITEQHLTHLAARKQDVLDHVEAMHAKYGDAIYAW